jgi:hypothetical protein
MVIQLLKDGIEGRLDGREINDPAALLVDWALNVDFNTKGVPVQPRALVASWHPGQAMRGLDVEHFVKFCLFDAHGIFSSL